MEETENPPEQIKDKQLETLERIFASLGRHWHSIDLLLNYVSQPLRVDDRGLHLTLNSLKETLKSVINAVEILDISQSMAEIKYIGQRLHSIEKDIASMKREGIKKNVQLEFTVDGYELVKKPVNYDKIDESGEIADPNQSLKDLLATLTKREGEVLTLRFGLFGEKKLTLAAAQKHIKVSRERVRQIESGALRKCRHPVRKSLVDKITHKDLKEAIAGEDD